MHGVEVGLHGVVFQNRPASTFSGVNRRNKCLRFLQSPHGIDFGFQNPIAQPFSLSSSLKNRLSILALRRVAMIGQHLIQFELRNRPREVHIVGMLEGTHLRRDAAHTLIEGESGTPSKPET